jgi:hypothetical protein
MSKKLIKEAGDHEVSMAHNSLKAIIDAATELQGKIGTMEFDIPGWIQDHIAKAENYITQASQNFHKLQEGIEDDVIVTNPNAGNPQVLTYGLWSVKNIGTSNVQVPTPDPNFDRDQIAHLASQHAMSREEYMAHYAVGANLDGSDSNN